MTRTTTINEFLIAARRPASINPIQNSYVGFGVLWGLAADALLVGTPDPMSSYAAGSLFPIQTSAGWHLVGLALLPLLLGWVFGAMGTVRSEHAAHQARTLALLDREVRNRTQSLRDMYLQAVLALSSAIEAKNHYTHGHCRRVFGFAKAAAEGLCLDERQLETLEYACYLHDIGKIGLPDAILDKPGALTAAEFAQVKDHSARGQQILSSIAGFDEIADLVRSHHERLDGTGYPDGLCGDQLPILARIIAVADTLDAMVSDRPYRKGMVMDSALAELRRCAGLPFELDLVAGRDKEPRNHFDGRVVLAIEAAILQGFKPASTSDGQIPAPLLAPFQRPRLNCWETLACGAQDCAPQDPGWCPVPFDTSLDGVNGGHNGGRACWAVSGARCRQGTLTAAPGDAASCAACPVLASVRTQEGPVWFQLAPQVETRHS